jgi:hypothetical protein
VHHLPHGLAAGVDRHHVISRVDQISHPAATEKSSAATTPLTATTAPASDRGFSGSEIYFSRRATPTATAALSAPASSGKNAASLHSLTQRTHGSSVAPRTHRRHAVAHRADAGGIGTLRKNPGRTTGRI